MDSTEHAVSGEREEGECTTMGGEAPQQQQDEDVQFSAYAGYLTPESKQKGDLGIYAAMDAMQLSRALHGVAESRLDLSQHPQQSLFPLAQAAAGGGVAGARANGAGKSSSSNTVQLGIEPEVFRHGASAAVQSMLRTAVGAAVQAAPSDAASAASVEEVRAAVLSAMEGGLCGTSATAVGLPDDVRTLQQVLPLVHEVKPREALNYDALLRLFAVMEGAADADAVGVTALLLAKGVVDPTREPAPSTAASEAKYLALQALYPLPSAAGGSADDANHNDDDRDEEEEEEEGTDGDRQHNAALQERCAALRLPYHNYRQALRDVAAHEMRVFPLLCAYLSHNEACRERVAVRDVDNGGAARATAHAELRHRACANVKVLNLASNRLAAPSVPAEADDGAAPVRQLAPLRALAAMLDANESLRYVNLRDNALGPRGVGILAKALTRNIALTGVDLSANQLGGAPADSSNGGDGGAEEVEDPLYEEEDPVFGETLEGLDALGELLKKNKFLRVLRLGENGLHAGEDLTGPPPADEENADEDEGADDGAASVDNEDGQSSRQQQQQQSKGLSIAAAQERWQGIPLWTLLTPLHRYHRLRVLDLSKNLLGNTGAHMVAVAVAHNRSIEVLDLTDNAIGFSGLRYLARYLLTGPPATSSAAAAAAPQPQQSNALHTLILRQNPLSCVGGSADAASGVDARRRRLTKRQQRQSARAIEGFAAALQRHGRLRSLVLANTYLGPAASAVVLRALAHVATLEELDFSFNNACGDHTATFDGAAVPYMAQLIFPPVASTALQRLCLDGNNITSAGLAALQPAETDTPASSALRELTLSRNSLGDALAPLAGVIAAGLTRLDLSYNEITTMTELVGELSYWQQQQQQEEPLVDLNVSHNKLGMQESMPGDLPPADGQEAEVRLFFECLAQMPQLAVLDVSYNDWRPGHVAQLSALLAEPTNMVSLRKLDVRHTPRVMGGPLLELLRHAATRASLEVFLASVPVEESADAAVTEDEANVGVRYDAAVQAIHAAVTASASLVDVDCGLRTADAEAGQAKEEMVAQIRERLLLNALMAAAKEPVMEE